MAIHGTIDMRIPLYTPVGTNPNGNNEAFVSLYNAFSNLSGLGVTRVAYNKGNSGSGMSYWDQGTPPGNGAWALFKFTHATKPFYVLLQAANLTTVSGFQYTDFADCSPCVTSDGTNYLLQIGYNNCVGLSVAVLLNGGNPWNGTSANTGTDTKGTPVWTAGASTLAVFPRCNSIGGTQATNSEAIAELITSCYYTGDNMPIDVVYNGGRIHFVADENNFVIAMNSAATGVFNFMYFGKYVSRAGISPQLPYVMLTNLMSSNIPFLNSTVYGSLSNSDITWGTNSGDGGIVHPVASNGVKIACVDYLNAVTNPGMFPSRVTQASNRFDMFPIMVGMSETSSYGLLGSLLFARYSCGMESGWTSSDKRLAAFGSVNSTTKLVIPWDGATVPGTGISRLGTSF